MPQLPASANHPYTSAGDFSSGEETDCSFVSAFEGFTEYAHCSASDEVENFVAGEGGRCNGTCKVDVKTQTSNCEVCNFAPSANVNQLAEETSEESLSPRTLSSLSLATATPSSESNSGEEYISVAGTESEGTISDCDALFTIRLKVTKRDKVTKSMVLQILDKESKDKISGQNMKTNEIPKSFANRSINSVARIIVADSVDRGTEVHREGVQQQRTEELNNQNIKEDGVIWRTSDQRQSEAQRDQSMKSHQTTTLSSDNKAESTIRRMSGDINDTSLLEHATWTMENLHEMWSQRNLCDVTITTSTGREFLAHSLVLALHSGTFGEVLSRSDSEEQKVWRITLDDSIRDKTFEHILHFMYTSVIQINYDTLPDLIQASVKLSIYRLTRLCMDYIENITVDNCFMLIDIAEKTGLNNHIAKAKSFIHDNFTAISTTESFFCLPVERVTALLAEDNLDVESEVNVFLAAKRWIQRNQDADMKSAPVVMKMIRFELFSPEELAEYVESVEWLMEIPEVRVQVLEAYRYLSLATTCEEKLRPPSPRHRGTKPPPAVRSKIKHTERVGQRSKHDVSTSMSTARGLEYTSVYAHHSDSKPKCDASTSISGEILSRSKHVSPTGQEQHTRPAAFSREKKPTAIILSGSAQKLPRKYSRNGVGVMHDQPKETVKTARTENINPEDYEDQEIDSEAHAERATAGRSLDDQKFQRKMPGISKTTVSSRRSNVPSGASKGSTKRSKGSLRKPLSDYRITTANPKAITKGPLAWPLPSNIVSSPPEDETSDLIVVSGGVSTSGDVDNPGKLMEIYDPRRAQWRDSISAPVARNHHMVQFLQDSIYVIGGSDPHGKGTDFIKPVNTVYRYDIRLGKWIETEPMASARIFHQVGALLGQLYVVGGQDDKGRTLDSVETYTPISDNWRQVAPISTPRYAVAMATYGQKLWVAGGYCEEAGSEMIDMVEYFNPYSEEWTPVKSLRAARCHANLLVAQGHLYLVGGYIMGNDGVEKHSTIDVYDEERNVWRFVADMEHGRHDGKTEAWHDKIYVFGARSDDEDERPLTRVDYFDIKERVWKKKATDLASPRFGHACCIIPSRSATNWL